MALHRNRNRQSGDTLVEVLVSVVVLSIAIVGAITLMTRGLSAAQTATEHTQVRLSITGQTEMLRYLRDAYLDNPDSPAGRTWAALFDGNPNYANTTQSSYTSNCAVTSGKNAFYLQQDSAGTVTIQGFNAANQPTTVAEPGRGLWIEATRSTAISPAYVNIQLRGCWAGVGDASQQQTVTVVRLYDPAH